MTQKNPSFFIHVSSMNQWHKVRRYELRVLKAMHKMKRILVVDDEQDTCLALTNVLIEKGFVVDASDNPPLALKNFRKDLYDILILDIKMPKMNGLELYREVKKIDSKVKVCFLTASEFKYEAFKDELSDLKENQFIQKPIGNEELIRIVYEISGSNYTIAL
jgi:two-component system, OmpR family, response regulator ChvI